MHILRDQKVSRAFALPTVLIASVVLLTVLAVSVTATVSLRTTLKNQYYAQLAQVAGEAGVAMAKACLASNGNVPQWTDAKPLGPATDCYGNVILTPIVKALVVAGGGSGGGSTGGGGGGGGVIYNDSVDISAPTYPVTYPVTVGGGGAIPGNKTRGISGTSSAFNGMSAVGGGGGGHSTGASNVSSAGFSGGSGGGGQNYYVPTASGAGTAGQGYAGGAPGTAAASGGGGAGGLGLAGVGSGIGGNGGPGVQYGTSGSMVYYGAGGGGGNGGIAGLGGMTTPGPGSGQAPSAVANTGNGGNGGWAYADGNGGAGGSGTVVISYPANSGIAATGGASVVTSGGNKIHKFTTVGSAASFVVTSPGTASCPSDPRCSVTVNGNIRSSFSIPKPTVDAGGKALTIANNGYVEITRTSNGSVWRTFKQPSVQSAVVPDLCSGNATSVRGWQFAVKASQQDSLASASAAQTITLADTALYAGSMYFRKDFNVVDNGTYELNTFTPSPQDNALVIIDGSPVATSNGSNATASVTLTPGCHVMAVKLSNQTSVSRASDFTLSLVRTGAKTPLVISDTTWRVTTGDSVHFSSSNYDETTAWEPVADVGIWSNTTLPWTTGYTNWQSVSGDALAEWISTKFTSGGTNRPFASYAWFRDSQPFTTATATSIRVSLGCDNSCVLYLDGNPVFTPNGTGVVSKTIPLQAGTHTFGVMLYNSGTAINPSGFLFAAVDLTPSTAVTLARSSANWDGTTSWSSTGPEIYSYDASFVPDPVIQPTSNVKALVVGGGGGGGSDMGGGGGGGGVVYNAALPLAEGSYSVTVGAGGSGGPAGAGMARGINGNNSLFSSLKAIGGGGGASEYADNRTPPGSGGSAGGNAGYGQTWRASGIIGQGNDSVPPYNPAAYYPTGGGGAGGVGGTAVANGGVGIQNDILGTNYYWAGGGGGSGYTGNGGNGGSGGGGGGAVGTTTGGTGGINNGAAGGGGTTVAQTNKPGGNAGANTGGGGGGGSHYNATNNGGNGASGIVVISYPTGSITATGGTITTNGSNTIHAFYSSGTFTVTSIPQPAALGVNIAPSFSSWTLSNGATYNAGTGEITLPSTNSLATSPLIRVDSITGIKIGAEFYATAAATSYSPVGGYTTGSSYYALDGSTNVMNSAGYTSNGCAHSIGLNIWATETTYCAYFGGSNIKYVRLTFSGNASYTSPGLKVRNPSIVFN